MDESEELIQEFLIESGENLARLDQEFVALEQDPTDRNLLSSIFRAIHTIKGTCGFLGFSALEALTHRAENLLSELRDGRRLLNPRLTTLLLETVDVVKGILATIEETGSEGSGDYEDLKARLQAASEQTDEPPADSEAPAAEAAVHAPIPAGKPPEVIGVGTASPDMTGTPDSGTPAAGDKPPRLGPGAALASGPGKPPKFAAPGAEAPLIFSPPPAIPERAEAAAQAQVAGLPGEGPAIASQAVEVGVAETPPPRTEPPVRVTTPPPEGPSESASDPEHPTTGRSSLAESTIRVDISVLNSLMNLVGELVLARNQILQFTTTWRDVAFTATSQRLNLITTELQAHIMKTRMQPIGVVWNKFPRVVRDLGLSFGKQIELEMEGADTELDKTIIEAIKDPLTHIVRNSCDHGIETPDVRVAAGKPSKGTLLLRAYHEGGQVNIEITDDGVGIDPQRLKAKALQSGALTPERAERMNEHELVNLVFLPGLSTAKAVTKVSGRGVGMDVVRTNIEKIGGSIDLQNRIGRGTTIKIRIPLTLAIIPALTVVCRGQRFAIPQVNLVELVRLEEGDEHKIESIQGAPVYRLRGKLLPLVYLDHILELDREEPRAAGGVSNLIVLQADERIFGLVVDGVNDTAEIVVKPLGKLLKEAACYAGATIMGDGAVALILDVMGLAQCGGVLGETKEPVIGQHEASEPAGPERQAVLLFRGAESERLAVPLSAVNRLEEFRRSTIEHSAGGQVVQYRDQILPLISLSSERFSGDAGEDERVQVIVFQNQHKRIGLMVDEILDIVEERITVRSRAARPGTLGSAVIGGKVTDLIDLRYLIESVDPDWFAASSASSASSARVMVAESSPLSRGLLRSYLEMAGFEVVEAGDSDEALRRLARRRVDVLLSSCDLAGASPFDLLRRVREAPDLHSLPVVCLSDDPGSIEGRVPAGMVFDECLAKFDQHAMLASVTRLAGALRSPAPDSAPLAR